MADLRLTLAADFLARAGWGGRVLVPLAGDASPRRYFRLPGGAVLMDADPARGERLDRFLAVGRWLLDRGYSAPKILAEDQAAGFLLLEDLGDALFARVIGENPGREGPLYQLATGFLADLHNHPPPAFVAQGDGAALAGLVRLLNDQYLPALGAPPATRIPALVQALYDGWNDTAPVLSLRDFHAENLLYLPERTGLRQAGILDFQDAFATHPAYDLVSLCQDARRTVSVTVEAECVRAYLDEKGLEQSRFSRLYALIGAQRALRILAVFAKLCRQDGKPQYLAHAPRVWAYLQRNLAHPALAPLAAAVADELPEPTEARLMVIAR